MLYIPHFIHTRYTSCLDTPGFMGIQPVLHGLPLPMRGISTSHPIQASHVAIQSSLTCQSRATTTPFGAVPQNRVAPSSLNSSKTRNWSISYFQTHPSIYQHHDPLIESLVLMVKPPQIHQKSTRDPSDHAARPHQRSPFACAHGLCSMALRGTASFRSQDRHQHVLEWLMRTCIYIYILYHYIYINYIYI